MLDSQELEIFIQSHKLIILVTHASCADGNMSALLFHRYVSPPYYLGEVGVRFVQYNSKELNGLLDEYEDKKGIGYLFVDMSPPREQLDRYLEIAGHVCVIDHHVGQKDIVEAFEDHGLYSDQPGMSGAVLLASLISNTIEDMQWYQMAIQVGIRDTWAKQMVGDNPKMWEVISDVSAALKFIKVPRQMTYEEVKNLIETLAPQLRLRKDDYTKSTLRKVEFFNCTPTFKVAIVPTTDISDISEYICVDAVVGFSFFNNTGMTVSLRSRRKDVNCAAFAKSIPNSGGGGHKSAAGFTIPMDQMTRNPMMTLQSLLFDHYTHFGVAEK